MINKSEEEIMKNWHGDIEKPVVSIRCLAYNHEKYIEKALDGFLMQETDFPFEIVVHDDASTDRTADIIREYEKNYPHIMRPIYETENQYSKHDGSMDEIIKKKIRGKYIAFCEGDDYWINSHKIQKQKEYLESHCEYSISFNTVLFVDKFGNRINDQAPRKNAFHTHRISLSDYTLEEYANLHWCFHTSSVFIRTEIYLKLAEARKKQLAFFPYGDMPLILWGLLNGYGYFINEELGCYRTNSGGYNSSLKSNTQKAIEAEKKLVRALMNFDKHTQFVYHSSIDIRVSYAQIKMLRLGYRQKNFINKIKRKLVWKKLSLKTRIGLVVLYYAPSIYRLKNIIKEKMHNK